MKKSIFSLFALAVLLLTSCIEDKGNYEYNELPEITISGLPAYVQVLGNVEYIDVCPTITSSTEGVIAEDNPNFTFQYRIGYATYGVLGGVDYDEEDLTSIVYHPWIDITPESGYHLHQFANFSSGAYIVWFTVTDNRNSTVTGTTFNVNVGLTTSEGWLLLGNKDSDHTARLDMISRINDNRIELIKDVAKNMPTVHGATCIEFVCKQSDPGDLVGVLSPEGGYILDPETLEFDGTRVFNDERFVADPQTQITKEFTFCAATWAWNCKYQFGFDDDGDAYVSTNDYYGLPMNTLTAGKDPDFKVAPACTYSQVRPWSSDYGSKALFYDETNQRFLLFDGAQGVSKLNIIEEPENAKFTYNNTGKKYVYAEGTRRSNGLSYWILENASGQRSIYMINLGGGGITQEDYIDVVDAPEFSQATMFAFHSQYPLCFYSTGTKLYCYNVATKAAKEIATNLKSGEVITCMKFNLYRDADYTAILDQSDEFMNQQYRLAVASFDASAGDEGGRFTMYDVDGPNSTATPSTDKWSCFTGLTRIVDLVYREQHE